MDAFRNFLTYGSELGVGHKADIRLESVPQVIDLLRRSEPDAVPEIIAAENPEAGVFALAMAVSVGRPQLRKAAFGALPQVCRTSEQLFAFCDACKGLRGWGRGMRSAIAHWYISKSPEELAQLNGEAQPGGEWNHRDLLRMSHPKPPSPEHEAAFAQLLRP